MMMQEQTAAVLEKIPDDKYVKRKNCKQAERRAVPARIQKFEDLDGNKKRRFPDGQPPGPGCAKHQPDPFGEGEQTEDQSAQCSPTDVGLGKLADSHGQVGKERAFR